MLLLFSVLFLICQTSDAIPTIIILQSVGFGLWAFCLVFFVCEILQRLSNAYEKVDDAIDRFNWYLFPQKMQRMLPIIMINTQQTFEITCFGSIACNRETFKKVSFLLKSHQTNQVLINRTIGWLNFRPSTKATLISWCYENFINEFFTCFRMKWHIDIFIAPIMLKNSTQFNLFFNYFEEIKISPSHNIFNVFLTFYFDVEFMYA